MAAHSRRTLALALALLLTLAAAAHANRAYDRVAAAYAQAGGQLDACAFTTTELRAGLDGIPREIARFVPDLRKAIEAAVAARERGDCAGRTPGAVTTPAPASGGSLPPPEVSPAPPSSTTVPAPSGAPTPRATTTTQQPAAAARHRDATPLLAVLVAIGALALLALALWGWARLRGWDPIWAARARHAWGEAGLRTTSTWSEFTDWLRPGRS